MYTTVLAPCALGGLQYEVAMAQSTHPPQDTTGTITAPYPAEVFAELLTHDPAQAFALLGEMTSEQRTAQASAYAHWLARYGLCISLDFICEAWGILAINAPAGL